MYYDIVRQKRDDLFTLEPTLSNVLSTTLQIVCLFPGYDTRYLFSRDDTTLCGKSQMMTGLPEN